MRIESAKEKVRETLGAQAKRPGGIDVINRVKCFLGIGLLFPALVWAAVDQNGDFQIWQRNFVIKHFANRWSSWTISELRWGDDASKLYYVLLQSQFYYRLVPWLIVGPGYQQAWTREPPAISWKPQYIPFADAIFRIRFSGWEIQDRNRLQYVLYDSSPSHWWYRNRFRVIAPSMLPSPHLAFFIDNECFWRQTAGVDEDRASGGLILQWMDIWGGEIFYMARFLKQMNGWIHNNVLSFAILISF